MLMAWGRNVVMVLGLAAMTDAQAASAVDLTVTGRVTPDACHIELTNDGTVDHGKIPAHSLNADEFTVLPIQTLDLRVQCARPMLFALVGIDERADSRRPQIISTGWAGISTSPKSAWVLWRWPIATRWAMRSPCR